MLDKIKIITEKNDAEKLLINGSKILENNFEYKKILNNFYEPDSFLFFCLDEDIIPLVIKDNLVSFYGGFHYNEYNTLPNNKTLLNFAIKYMNDKKLSFRLLSIKSDYIEILDEEKYDVPYGANWEVDSIDTYNLASILESYNSKKRNKILQPIRKKNEYTFKIYYDFEYIQEILNLSSDYFKNRSIAFGWDGKENLFNSIIKYFKEYFDTFFKIIYKNNIMHGVYLLIYQENEAVYFFGGPLTNDNNISTIIYEDIVQECRRLNINKLDAMRGSFGYKKKFGFQPKPLYALVGDKNWNKVLDSDFSIEEYNELFNRNIDLEM